MNISEFLDNPIVVSILIFVAFVTLVKWLVKLAEWMTGRSTLFPYKGLSATRKRQLLPLIAKLSTRERNDIKILLNHNQKIEAIKTFRAATNAGLRDSKECVEYLADSMSA